VFGWFKSEHRERRRKVRLDRKHLEARTRCFLKNFLDADETGKPHFYHAIEAASKQCHPAEPLVEFDDAHIAEATSDEAMKMVLERRVLKKNDPSIDFITDAYATVAVAYHRAAGIYTMDKDMQELGTAAVHLLTMASSYIRARKD